MAPPVFEAPPPTFDQFLGGVNEVVAADPIKTTSYPSLASMPEPVRQQPAAVVRQPAQPSPAVQQRNDASLDMSDTAVAQQREILEQIERKKRGGASASVPAASSTSSSQPLTSQHEIAPGEKITLYSAEATKNAVKEGSAQLVKCLSCNGWMQVINSAALVFCPSCQVISPVSAENTKPMDSVTPSTISSVPGEAPLRPVASTSSSTYDNDAALAAMLQAQFDEEDAVSGEEEEGDATHRPLPDIMQSSSMTAEQRQAHIDSLSPSQRALHGLEGQQSRRALLPVNVGTEIASLPAREVQSGGMLSCLRTGVESAGSAVSAALPSVESLNFLGRRRNGGAYPHTGGLVMANVRDNTDDAAYALLEEEDL